MTIPSLTTTGSTALTSTPHARGKGPFDAVSGLLGMSASDIASAVRSGTSLNDLASSKGVSHDDLIAALKAGAPEDLQGSADLDAMVEEIASASGPEAVRGPQGAGGPRGHHGPPPPPPTDDDDDTTGLLSGNLTDTQQSVLDTLSALLDTSSEDLLADLQGGAGLSDLLQSGGVTMDQLSSALQSGLTASGGAGLLVDSRL